MPKPKKESILAKIPLVRKLYATHLRQKAEIEKQQKPIAEETDYQQQNNLKDEWTEEETTTDLDWFEE